MAPRLVPSPQRTLGSRLFATRRLTLDLAAPLSDADATIQPFPDASPAKWHLAHTTWFFETFVLRDHVARLSGRSTSATPILFNSYYEAEGPRHARPRRGMLSRPSLDEVRGYRAHVDEALERRLPRFRRRRLTLIELGINHEQQHQELFLTDILATFAREPAGARLWRVAAARLLRGRAAELASRPRGHRRDRRRLTTASPSTASARGTGSSCRGIKSPTAESRTRNGASSSTMAAIARRPCGCPTAGRGSSRKASVRRSTGGDDGTEFTLGGRREIDWAAPVCACQLLRSRRVRPLGGAAASDRSRVGRFRRLGRPG